MADSGAALLVLGLLLLMSKPKKLTSSSFINGGGGGSPSYASYYYYATASAEDVEADDQSELTESSPITQTATQSGVWRTINGRIPTPRGTTIPMVTRRPRGSRIAVETMLQPLEEAKEEPHFQDVAGRRSVNLRLKPM